MLLMSSFVASMASASLRHARDAQALATGAHRSLDQAWHLAGFGPECSLKASLSDDWFGRAIGHVGGLTPRLAAWLLAVDPLAHRRLGSDGAEDPLHGWSPTVRYERTGWALDHDIDVNSDVDRAATVTIDRVAALWVAGDLTSDALSHEA